MRNTKAFAIPATIIVALILCVACATVFTALGGAFPDWAGFFRICNIVSGGIIGLNLSRIYRMVKGTHAGRR